MKSDKLSPFFSIPTVLILNDLLSRLQPYRLHILICLPCEKHHRTSVPVAEERLTPYQPLLGIELIPVPFEPKSVLIPLDSDLQEVDRNLRKPLDFFPGIGPEIKLNASPGKAVLLLNQVSHMPRGPFEHRFFRSVRKCLELLDCVGQLL